MRVYLCGTTVVDNQSQQVVPEHNLSLKCCSIGIHTSKGINWHYLCFQGRTFLSSQIFGLKKNCHGNDVLRLPHNNNNIRCAYTWVKELTSPLQCELALTQHDVSIVFWQPMLLPCLWALVCKLNGISMINWWNGRLSWEGNCWVHQVWLSWQTWMSAWWPVCIYISPNPNT